jgi:hypothetical protein
MQGISITGCKPRPDALAAIEIEHARLEERARRWSPPIETRARCTTCGFDCLDAAGTRCLYCGNGQLPNGGMCVEHRATSAPSQRTTTRPVRVEHSQHIGRIIDVR